ncbi:MAG: hypothetical protein RL325_1062 [Planctomycetota bacterium]|jgi:hypothetical protein
MTAKKTGFWIVVAAAIVPTVAMTIFAWRMVGNVRKDAAVTDARLRELAWACLAYADRFEGFPTGEAELRAFAVPDALGRPGEGYPATRGDAAQASPAPTLDECLESIEVEWPIARDVQPILRPKGKPTLQGTAPTVGQWLFAMAERLRG